MQDGADATTPSEEVRCAECDRLLAEGEDRVATDEAVFCRTCYDVLTAQLEQVVAAQGEGINYPMAVAGGLAGAAVGILVWWGFTVLTSIAFGLVAIVIGFTVGKGITLLSGGKRHLNLQFLSAFISLLAFFYASYLVNRTFVQRAYAEQGEEILLPLVPEPALAVEIIGLDFGIMDLVFLAIVVFQAWQMPAPLKLAD